MNDRLRAIFASEQPTFFLVGGPNGAGKSTFRKTYFDPNDFYCIDPDKVAIEMLGRKPATDDESLAASKEADKRTREAFDAGVSFALETVFSDRQGLKLGLLKEARNRHFRVGVIFIGVNDPNLSILRVNDRVDEGGHDVPEALIRERFPRAFENLKKAIPESDVVLLIDNSGEAKLRLFAVKFSNHDFQIWDTTPYWFSHFEVERS